MGIVANSASHRLNRWRCVMGSWPDRAAPVPVRAVSGPNIDERTAGGDISGSVVDRIRKTAAVAPQTKINNRAAITCRAAAQPKIAAIKRVAEVINVCSASGSVLNHMGIMAVTA